MYICFKLKRAIACILIAAALAAILPIGSLLTSAHTDEAEKGIFLPAIMYHSICGDEPQEYICTPEQADNDLKWLYDNGYKTVSAEQLIDYTHGKGELPDKPVLITLDDGFYNNLSELLPLLEKYDMCAVVSVVGRYTDDYAPADPHCPRYSYLTWEDISELIASGRVEIGNHTYDMHTVNGRRNGCSKNYGEDNEQYSEALNSDISVLQTELIQNTGYEPVVFAYPFGIVSRESLPVLRENGILMTLTCREAPNHITRDPDSLYGINRYNRSGYYSTEEFMARITNDSQSQ